MAEDDLNDSKAELSLHSSGDMLRHAREQKNLSIEDIAKTTRIPQRHLKSIEAGDFAALPGRTYAIGFAKSYARAVGISEVTIGTQLREEMDEQGHAAYQPETSGYSPANPTSIPPKMLAFTAAGIGALVLVGYLIWRTLVLEPSSLATDINETDVAGEVLDENQTGTPQVAAGPAPAQTGTVVLTATEKVWLKIYDEDGERLFEKEMAAGEKFTVPADAKGPQILTGRPDALTVTIDGQVVPALGTAERTIKDVGISAAALLARGEAGAGAGTIATQNGNDDSDTN
ncbi:helix-turn-helix domain-containing protein [Parasphingorhabdus halotolerans]|uniref:Helix-turn-helix domain-containing protein n=1 Tax=Parasphingorhabdus halotolerans TaxID=2725558 RepID=A0A6H2DMF3_9SPHN|nr:RodZ domain-containing protein [Parasphingorhabdus halotolerans]QJB69135.1 helix-turn-helix domain-containing protein [Parasphingorhabdus halotolerans]